MSERTTGATDEQIEAAARRHIWWIENGARNQDIVFKMETWAQWLVPPGYVIAREGDVLTPDDRKAIVNVCAEASDYLALHGDELTDEEQVYLEKSLKHLRRFLAIGGDECPW